MGNDVNAVPKPEKKAKKGKGAKPAKGREDYWQYPKDALVFDSDKKKAKK